VTETPSATPTPVTGTTYTVQPGDGLFAIARAFGTTVEQLQAWNAGRYPTLAANPNVIEPGWVLVVSLEPGVTPRPTPTPAPASPRPTQQPPPTGACTAGNRVAAGAAQTFRTIPNAGPGVALTFDMGGRMDPAVDIMNFLVANRVCATIFATGIMSQTPQGQQVMAIIGRIRGCSRSRTTRCTTATSSAAAAAHRAPPRAPAVRSAPSASARK
jgi:LysM repeat protein